MGIGQQIEQLLVLIGVLTVVTARVWPLLRQGILVGDELPFSLDDGAGPQTFAGLVSRNHVVGEVVEEDGCSVGNGLVVEQIDPGHPRRDVDSAGGENGRNQVDVAGQFHLLLVRLDPGGPAGDDRRPDPVLVRGGLAEFIPAIVGQVEHQGVVVDTLVLQVFHQVAAGFVEPFHHGVVLGLLGRLNVGVFVQKTLRRVVGRMRQKRRVPDEEGLLVLDRLIHEVVDGLHGLAAYVEGFSAVSARFSVVVGKASGSRLPHPIFSGMHGVVTGIGQQLRQHGVLEETIEPDVAILSFDGIVAGDAVMMGV